MKLMLKSRDDMEKWFKENGWEETKTKFGRGWKKEGWKPWLDQFYFYAMRVFNTDADVLGEEFEERKDDEGRKVLFFPGVKKHFYPEWMENALMHKLDAALDASGDLGSDEDFWK